MRCNSPALDQYQPHLVHRFGAAAATQALFAGQQQQQQLLLHQQQQQLLQQWHLMEHGLFLSPGSKDLVGSNGMGGMGAC
jgi:hypothetical protein